MTERLSEYFSDESNDYLDRLERLLAAPGTPDPEEMLRLARGLRGSARMGGVDTVAGVAERIEDALHSVITNGVSWSDEVRQLAMQTVQDIRVLMRALNRWGPAEEARVRNAIERWDDLASERRGPVVPISTLFYDGDGPHLVEEPPLEKGEVRIESLLLRGEAARRAALALRPEVERAMSGQPGARGLDDLVDELFDLIDLAVDEGDAEESATAG